MKLDPGIHIVMHSVLFLKPGVSKIVGKLYNHVLIVENCYYIYEFNIFYIVAI